MATISSYIAKCPFAPESSCQACGEKSTFNRILTCYECLKDDAIMEKYGCNETNRNLWQTATPDDTTGVDNHYKEQNSHCSSFLFCGDCMQALGIRGYCCNQAKKPEYESHFPPCK